MLYLFKSRFIKKNLLQFRYYKLVKKKLYLETKNGIVKDISEIQNVKLIFVKVKLKNTHLKR